MFSYEQIVAHSESVTSSVNPRAKECRLWARKNLYARIALGQCVLVSETSVSLVSVSGCHHCSFNTNVKVKQVSESMLEVVTGLYRCLNNGASSMLVRMCCQNAPGLASKSWSLGTSETVVIKSSFHHQQSIVIKPCSDHPSDRASLLHGEECLY